MPNRQLAQRDNFETISTWLDENLINPFEANMQSLPPEDNSRGIYFWFMKPEGYTKLSALGLNITAINPTYTKTINKGTYHLVYIGTAGTGKKGNSNIINRLNWHLKTTHSEGDVCSGILSTLRQTIGAALSTDLIETETAAKVSILLKEHFYIYVLPYLGDANTKEQIDNDEHQLISVLKPLFNIKNNPNARITAGQNPTRQLKVRRGFVMRNTRERLGCKNGNNGKTKSKKDDIKPPKSPINNYELIYDKDGCQEFTVTKDQSVHDVVSGIEGLPTGKCEIVIYNSTNPKTFIYTSKHNNGKRVTGDKKISIYGYFNNIDTNRNNQPRWKVIQQEMLDKGIEEITVRVCSDRFYEQEITLNINEKKRERPRKKESANTNNKVKSVKVRKTLEEFKEEIKKLNLNRNFKIVYTCAEKKFPNTDLFYNQNKIDFKWVADHENNQYTPFDNVPGENIRWSCKLKEINQQLDDSIPEAFRLYKRGIYTKLRQCFGDRFFIASAGWGIVKSDFRLPNYDITFSAKAIGTSSYRNPVDGYENDIKDIQIINNPDDENYTIVFLGPPDYLNQFISLTQNLPNRKIIFTNTELNNNLVNIHDLDTKFEYHYLNMTDRSKWYEKIAKWLCEIYCPNNHE